MHYLIDGHNLIAKMPDISLSDPDDEVQLILRLRSWTAASKKRQVTVYFDGGIPGGKNVKLSTPQVRVRFASLGHTADAQIIKRINKVKNPPEYTLISSDQQIIAAAEARRMPVERSDKFAMRLGRQWQDTPPGPTLTDEDPILSDAEIDEWLATFGPVDEKALRRRPKPTPPNTPPPPEPEETAVAPPAAHNREDPQMSEPELEEWLTLFSDAAKPTPPPPADKEADTAKKPPPRRRRKKSPNPHNLNRDDLAAWQAYFGQDE